MGKKIIFALIISSFIGMTTAYGTWKSSITTPPLKAAENYIRAVASGNVDAALEHSSGTAAFIVSRLKDSNITAEVNDISCSVSALGRDWAKVPATVELTLQDGSVDVGWYSMDVVKTSQDWKVVSFREEEPKMSGTILLASRSEAGKAKQVFQSYLDALSGGNWQEAAQYLAGPARKNFEMGATVLGKGVIIGKVKDLKAKPLWKRKNQMAVEFNYKTDDRDVAVLSWFYETRQGWKIVGIVQK